jgi:hypothetical protein
MCNAPWCCLQKLFASTDNETPSQRNFTALSQQTKWDVRVTCMAGFQPCLFDALVLLARFERYEVQDDNGGLRNFLLRNVFFYEMDSFI